MRLYRHPDHPDFELYISGNSPRILITSGIHGDEFETIDLLSSVLLQYSASIPPFFYIPQISPSAVTSKTRHNANLLDLNRNFYSDSTEPEVVRVREVLQGMSFDLHMSFHEDLDPAVNSFYVYDLGLDGIENKHLKSFAQSIEKELYPILNGLDDPADTALGYEFENGYRRFITTPDNSENGTIEDYVLLRHGAKNVWTPEIPGLAPRVTKRLIIEKFIRELLTTD